MSNEQFAQTIRQDRIDILVDLSLHMSGDRLASFGYRSAPIQVTFAGYPGSTGMKSIDYRLTDPHLDPPEQESTTPERPVHLPASFWCYDPVAMTLGPGEAIEVSPLPAQANGFVTFGCLNNFCKVNESVLKLWAGVLWGVPGSHLRMLSPESSREQVMATLIREGVNPEYIHIVPKCSRAEYLRNYHKIDIGLDTFPYNGHTTSLDALWMGVPVITLVGKTIVGRAGLSQLSNLGLTDLAAESESRYIEIAVELAGNLHRLNELRGGLRSRMRQSPLTNAYEFTKGVEAAYSWMWSELKRKDGNRI
jgi:predicted O-linked N-acetylglucosamine transferase (SPINDLY family)